jgi:hypothetical protein
MVNLTLLEMNIKTEKDGKLMDTIVSCGTMIISFILIMAPLFF